jgi:HAMP domain-containing protein
MSNPYRDRRPPAGEQLSDELVLAAIERAIRHRARDTDVAPSWAIFAHLSVPRRSGAARHVNVRLDVLHAAGWIEPIRMHGVAAWRLTGAGQRHLKRARRRGEVGELPESPQHQAWRDAHRAAAQEIDRFRGTLRGHLGEAERLLDLAHPPAGSDELFELAERLLRSCRHLASATYCLYEWGEPDDARADLESHLDLAGAGLSASEQALRRGRRAGRRNVRLWGADRRVPPC